MNIRPSFVLALALFTLTAGCAKKNGAGGAAVTGADSDTVNGTPLPERQEGVSFMDASVSKSRFASVHFAFDGFNIDPADNDKVQAVAQFLQGNRNNVIVAGFCDERGTAEYNRALGEKRAEAVRDALIADGVDSNRVQTVSFGAEMPVDPGSNESAWAKNRRAEFGVTK